MESLALAKRLNERRYLSFDKRQLAKIYMDTGRTRLARQTAEEALELFQNLGMPGMVAATQDMLQEMR